jgi:mycothiol synthase
VTRATLRPPRLDEARAVAEVVSPWLPEPLPEEVVRRDWTAPGRNLGGDLVVALDGTGIIGYADVDDVEKKHERFFSGVFGRPLDELLAWVDARVRESAVPGARHLCAPWSENADVKQALDERGFRLVRHSYRMAIDLAEATPAPVWPAGVEVRSLRAGDEGAVYDAHMETFEDTWEHVHSSYDEWAHWLLAEERFDPSLWFLAWDGEELAGIALCCEHWSDERVGWIRVLGVRRPWRRRGLARGLLLHAFRELRNRGFRRAGLGVDAESLTGANRLYESAGMRVEQRFDIYERVLP